MRAYVGLSALLFAAAFLSSSPAQALTCSATISDINFGAVDTLSATPVLSTATMNVSCSAGLPLETVAVCMALNAGSGGVSPADRRMLSGASQLGYQLYSNPGRTVVWGNTQVFATSVGLGLGGSGSGSATIYGTVFGGQGTAAPGSYISTFSGSGQVAIQYGINLLNTCLLTGFQTTTSSFNVRATVASNCLLTTQNIDFGLHGLLTSNVDATGEINVTCTPTTSYQVGIGNGLTGTGPTDRRMTLGANAVIYGLYKDTARSQPWSTVAPGGTVGGSGAGSAQNYTVYGRVPPQTTPPPGIYNDTVAITVTY
jgi:spore coat protein U-like protein